MQGLPQPVGGGCAPERWKRPIVQSRKLSDAEGICKIQLPDIRPPLGGSKKYPRAVGGQWTCCCGDRTIGLTHRSGAHPLPTGGGSPCTGGRGGFPHRYKPSSLLRPYIADTSALPMLELGSMPVVTTMDGREVGEAAHLRGERGLWC